MSANASIPEGAATPTQGGRITSIDALRGLVVFTMIFVNDLAGVSPKIVPAWMRHYHGKSGMTFVDLVFPAFLFVVGMSIPQALGPRLDRGEPLWKSLVHLIVRTSSLLLIGILMAHESPDANHLGWSAALWSTLMFASAIVAFSSFGSSRGRAGGVTPGRGLQISLFALKAIGLASLLLLALAFRGEHNERILSFSPLALNVSWYGILGLIGWAYLVSALVFLCFRGRSTALLGSMVLLLCLYAADHRGAFEGFWLQDVVNIGETLGSLSSIAVAGVLLGSILSDRSAMTPAARARFVGWFVAGCGAGALLLHRLYGISKNNATPSWCLWSCAITATLWLGFHFLADVRRWSWTSKLTRPLALAGGNVLLAYLLSEMLPSLLELLKLDDAYGALAGSNLACAVARSAGCAFVLLSLTVLLNRVGFRLRL